MNSPLSVLKVVLFFDLPSHVASQVSHVIEVYSRGLSSLAQGLYHPLCSKILRHPLLLSSILIFPLLFANVNILALISSLPLFVVIICFHSLVVLLLISILFLFLKLLLMYYLILIGDMQWKKKWILWMLMMLGM